MRPCSLVDVVAKGPPAGPRSAFRSPKIMTSLSKERMLRVESVQSRASLKGSVHPDRDGK